MWATCHKYFGFCGDLFMAYYHVYFQNHSVCTSNKECVSSLLGMSPDLVY